MIGSIDRGLVTLLGWRPATARRRPVPRGQDPPSPDLRRRAGKFQHSVLDTRGGCLLVSQFTLLANTRRGRRPDFLGAAAPDVAAPLVKEVAETAPRGGVPVVEGRFGAHMVVRLANDGPVTILLDSRERA